MFQDDLPPFDTQTALEVIKEDLTAVEAGSQLKPCDSYKEIRLFSAISDVLVKLLSYFTTVIFNLILIFNLCDLRTSNVQMVG